MQTRSMIALAGLWIAACSGSLASQPSEPVVEEPDPEVAELADPEGVSPPPTRATTPTLPAHRGERPAIDPVLGEPTAPATWAHADRARLAAIAGLEIVEGVAPDATGFAVAADRGERIAVFVDVEAGGHSELPPPPPPPPGAAPPPPAARLLIEAPADTFAVVATRGLMARPTANTAGAPGFELRAGDPIAPGARAGSLVKVTREAPLWTGEGYVPADAIGRLYARSPRHAILTPDDTGWLAPGTVLRASPGGAGFATLAPPPPGAEHAGYRVSLLVKKGRHRLVVLARQDGFTGIIGGSAILVGWVGDAELQAQPGARDHVDGGGFVRPLASEQRPTLSLPAGTWLWAPDGDAVIGVVYSKVDAVYLGRRRGRALVEVSTELGTVRLAATAP